MTTMIHGWKVVLLVALATSSYPAMADNEFGFMIKGGFTAATQAEDNRESRYGASGGLASYLQRRLVGSFSLGGQLELLYTPRGAKVIDNGEVLSEFQEKYLDVAFIARPELRFGRASVYLLLGGSLDLLLSARKDDQDIIEALHRVDVALIAGIGARLHLPEWRLGPVHLGSIFLEGRHDHGLLDHAVDGGLDNRASSLMLGLSFAWTSAQPPEPTKLTKPTK